MSEWRSLDNYGWFLRINREGVLQRYHRGAWVTKKPLTGTHWRTPRYKVKLGDGTYTSIMATDLVAEAFDGIKPRRCRCRIVEKIDSDGNVLATYRSVDEAAEANYVTRTVVTCRCLNKLKTDPFRLSDFTFRYKEE